MALDIIPTRVNLSKQRVDNDLFCALSLLQKRLSLEVEQHTRNPNYYQIFGKNLTSNRAMLDRRIDTIASVMKRVLTLDSPLNPPPRSKVI